MATRLNSTDVLDDGLIPGAFAHVFKSSPLGLCIVNANLTYVEINQTWCDMLGYERDELLELSFLDVTHSEDRDLDRGLSEQLFAASIPYFEIEKRWSRKDGSLFRGKLLASVLHKKGSEPWGIGIIEPISTAAFEGGSAPAESRKELVGQLATGVAHDLNNILMIVSANAQRLQKRYGEASETNASGRACGGALPRAAHRRPIFSRTSRRNIDRRVSSSPGTTARGAPSPGALDRHAPRGGSGCHGSLERSSNRSDPDEFGPQRPRRDSIGRGD